MFEESVYLARTNTKFRHQAYVRYALMCLMGVLSLAVAMICMARFIDAVDMIMPCLIAAALIPFGAVHGALRDAYLKVKEDSTRQSGWR